MAMEMRARESVNMSEDLTGAIAPYATALHDTFLHSHCSSCFCKLPQRPPYVMSCTICCSVRYCCTECLISDSVVHSSSGECRFFVNDIKKVPPSYDTEGTSDLRAALRLLYLFETRDLVSSDLVNRFGRICGLSASGIEEALEDGEDIAERILEWSLLMSSARESSAHAAVCFSDGRMVESVALWAVITNSVEVQVSEGQAMGIAVYGPSFSWFNHSCFPNASYRFVLAPWNEDCMSHKSKSCLVPASKGVAADEWLAWQYEEDNSTRATCKYGPRVVVRCIKPINKEDEVCITYVDLLQTREARRLDLWSKYKFICSCKRCIASPEPYMDRILNCDARNLKKPEDAVTAQAVEDLDDVLQQAISEYSSGDDPKACCDMIESMLFQNMISDLQHEELSGRRHILHPLHYICLTAYMTLASAYRFRALSLKTGSLIGENGGDFVRMAKAAAAYSLILAGSTHHLFLSECSFMMPLSHFLLSAGQSMLYLVESIKGEMRQNVPEAKFTCSSCPGSSAEYDSVQYHEFRSTCEGFGKQMLSLSLHCWSFLVQSSPCLEKIKNPIEFSWLGTAIVKSPHLSEEDYASLSALEPAAFLEGSPFFQAYWRNISYKNSGVNDNERSYNKTNTDDYGHGSEDYGRGTGGFNKSGTDDYNGGYKSTNTNDYGSGGGYNKSSTDDYGSGGGYNKSSTDDYGSGGGYNKSSTDDLSSDYNKSGTDDYNGSGGYNKSSTDNYGSDYNKSSTDDNSGSGGYNKSSTDNYGSGGGYNNSGTDNLSSDYNKSGNDDYSGSRGYSKSSTDDYGSGLKDSSTGDYGRGNEYKKPSSDDYDGGYKNSSTEGYGGYNKSSTDNYNSGKNTSNTDNYGNSGYNNKSSTDNYDSGYNKSSTDDFGRSGSYNKSSTDNYDSGYNKSNADDFGRSGGYNMSGSDEYTTGSGRSRTNTDKY
ncbi:hypothetical protein ACP70R_009548 [Stipagrostis hirtigluma subsp. patula]